MRARWAIAASAALVLAGLGLGVVRTRLEPPGRPNVLLVSIDTLRADHLGYDGYARDTSPHLDRLAARARRYREAFAPAPWTLPSHVALLTGTHPRRLGIGDRNASLAAGTETLASRLAAAGYETAAFVDSLPRGFVGAERGFGHGFDRYVHLPAEAPGAFRYDVAVSVDRAAAWLRRRDRTRPFFLFLHTKSVHALPSSAPSADPHRPPYDQPEPFRGRYLSAAGRALAWDDPELGHGVGWLRGWNEAVAVGQRNPGDLPAERREALIAQYDAGIRYVDHHLGRLLGALAETGQEPDTLVVVTSDHGEAFAEHELLLHKELYRELLRVPLLVRVPGDAAGRDVTTRVTLMDVAPTLLALVGVATPASFSGRTLPESDAADVEPEPLFSYYRSWPDGYYEAYGLRDGRYSLVQRRLGRGAGYESFLYDLERDPGEQQPLGAEAAGRRTAMLGQLGALRAQAGTSGRRIGLDAETRRHLEALGYLEGPANRARATDSSSRP